LEVLETISRPQPKKSGYHRLKHKPWFDDDCSKLIDQLKQTKLQWLKNPSLISGDNLQKLRHEASRTFRNEKTEYPKDKINELQANNKNKNIRIFTEA
jgi:hypothetical protein